MKKLVIVAMIILLAGMLLVSVSSAETQVTVTPANMNGWAFSFDDTSTTGIGSFAVGPAASQLGVGSARLAVLDDLGNARPILGHVYPETRLDAITQLKYSTYVDPVSGASVDITLALNVDYDITDADTSWQGRLTYEPYMSGTVLKGQWQTWDTLAGKWWASKAPGNTFCPQSTPCTWSEVLDHFPNAGIHGTLGAIILKAGGGSIGWAHFNGYTDNLLVGVDNVDTVYDFEPPSTVYVNASWAPTQQWNDPDGSGPAHAMGLDAFATIQEGVDAVAPGGTVEVAAGTYDENVVINKAITLQGAGKDVTFIDGVNTGTSDTTVNITAGGDVTVEGFTITNALTTNATDKRFGVLTNSPVADVTYTITNNKVIGTNNPDNQEDYGIYGQNGGKENLVITHNVVTQTGANNIVVEAHQGTTGISYNTLDAGTYGTDAIFIMTHSAKDVSNKQTVSDNDIDMSTGIGTSGATGISFATVAGTYGTTPARFLAGSIEISNNTIHDLKANRRGVGFWNDAAAGQGADGDIISPLVINNSVEAVTGNPAGSMGIDTIGQVSNAEITNNAISNVDFCYKERVWNENIASGTLLNQNSFVNCADGVTTERTTGTLDTTQNWWDSQFGPTNTSNPGGDGQIVSDNVTFDPWLCSGVDSDPSAVGFQPASVDGCTAAAPTQLVFSTQPGGAIFNHPLNPQPVVVAQNANGDRSVNFNQDVSVSLGGGATGAALKGDATVTAVNGVAIFSGLSIDKPGKGYTLTALSLNPQLEMLSNPFDVSALVLYLPSIYR